VVFYSLKVFQHEMQLCASVCAYACARVRSCTCVVVHSYCNSEQLHQCYLPYFFFLFSLLLSVRMPVHVIECLHGLLSLPLSVSPPHRLLHWPIVLIPFPHVPEPPLRVLMSCCMFRLLCLFVPVCLVGSLLFCCTVHFIGLFFFFRFVGLCPHWYKGYYFTTPLRRLQ